MDAKTIPHRTVHSLCCGNCWDGCAATPWQLAGSNSCPQLPGV